MHQPSREMAGTVAAPGESGANLTETDEVPVSIQTIAGEGSGTGSSNSDPAIANAKATPAAVAGSEEHVEPAIQAEIGLSAAAGENPGRASAADPETTGTAAIPGERRPTRNAAPKVAAVDPQTARQSASEHQVTEAAYRQRADRLLERARRQLDAGHREEALRLAQIAQRLETTQKVHYGPDEESPSRFVAAVQAGTTSDPLPRPPAANDPGRVTGPVQAAPGDEAQTAVANPAPATSYAPVVEAPVVVLPDPDAPTTSEGAAVVEGLAGIHRFHRSVRRQPGPGEITVVPSGEALAEFERLAELESASRTGADISGAEASAPEAPEEAAPELRDLPLELTNPAAATARLTWLSPRVRWWLTWNRLSFLGLMTGLTCLVVLWVWRELERWHHRGVLRAGLAG